MFRSDDRGKSADDFLSVFIPFDTVDNVDRFWPRPRDSSGRDLEFEPTSLEQPVRMARFAIMYCNALRLDKAFDRDEIAGKEIVSGAVGDMKYLRRDWTSGCRFKQILASCCEFGNYGGCKQKWTDSKGCNLTPKTATLVAVLGDKL